MENYMMGISDRAVKIINTLPLEANYQSYRAYRGAVAQLCGDKNPHPECGFFTAGYEAAKNGDSDDN
jgi:hypothetical protein